MTFWEKLGEIMASPSILAGVIGASMTGFYTLLRKILTDSRRIDLLESDHQHLVERMLQQDSHIDQRFDIMDNRHNEIHDDIKEIRKALRGEN